MAFAKVSAKIGFQTRFFIDIGWFVSIKVDTQLCLLQNHRACPTFWRHMHAHLSHYYDELYQSWNYSSCRLQKCLQFETTLPSNLESITKQNYYAYIHNTSHARMFRIWMFWNKLLVWCARLCHGQKKQEPHKQSRTQCPCTGGRDPCTRGDGHRNRVQQLFRAVMREWRF